MPARIDVGQLADIGQLPQVRQAEQAGSLFPADKLRHRQNFKTEGSHFAARKRLAHALQKAQINRHLAERHGLDPAPA